MLQQKLPSLIMDIIPFINKNGLWHLDMPELIDPILTSTNQLIVAERSSVEFLNTLAGSKKNPLILEFHYEYFNPYDAKLIRKGSMYICTSIFYKEKDLLLWFPPYFSRAMKSSLNPLNIWIKVSDTISN